MNTKVRVCHTFTGINICLNHLRHQNDILVLLILFHRGFVGQAKEIFISILVVIEVGEERFQLFRTSMELSLIFSPITPISCILLSFLFLFFLF